MTTTFYFNELLPAQPQCDVYAVCEQSVMRTALLLKKLNLSIQLVTHTDKSNIQIGGLPLVQLINGFSNRNVKIVAHQMFSHNLISDHEGELPSEAWDELLLAEYRFCGADALNLAIAHRIDLPLFSLPLCDDLQRDVLTLTSSTAASIDAANYYAQTDTAFIENWISNRTAATLEGLDKLKTLLGIDRVIVDCYFEKEWSAATRQCQKIAIDRFAFALSRNMLFPVRADDVTIQKDEVKGMPDVYELKQKGQGVRVYFGYSEDGTTLVLALFNTKSKATGKEQSADIERAQRRIRRALAVNKLR